ncbi:MAG: hypothetical protein D6752_02575, partial [Candidatus Nitrosothermus koennekii]
TLDKFQCLCKFLQYLCTTIAYLDEVTAVAFQISSLDDLIMDECNDQNGQDKSEQFKDCKWFEDNLLKIEIFIRAFTLILLGNLFIALKRRLERK